MSRIHSIQKMSRLGLKLVELPDGARLPHASSDAGIINSGDLIGTNGC